MIKPAHENGISAEVLMCGDGETGESTIYNTFVHADAFSLTLHKGWSATAGELPTLINDPECPKEIS